MDIRYEEVMAIITERLAARAAERLASDARRTRLEHARRLAQIRTRAGRAIEGAGAAFAEQCCPDDSRASMRPAG